MQEAKLLSLGAAEEVVEVDEWEDAQVAAREQVARAKLDSCIEACRLVSIHFTDQTCSASIAEDSLIPYRSDCPHSWRCLWETYGDMCALLCYPQHYHNVSNTRLLEVQLCVLSGPGGSLSRGGQAGA